jgi:hypothetical protein
MSGLSVRVAIGKLGRHVRDRKAGAKVVATGCAALAGDHLEYLEGSVSRTGEVLVAQAQTRTTTPNVASSSLSAPAARNFARERIRASSRDSA